MLRETQQVKLIVTLKSLRTLKTSRAQVDKCCSSRYRSKSRFKLAWTQTFTVISSRKFQNLMFFLNASPGHWKGCGGPHVARGPLIAHPCLKLCSWLPINFQDYFITAVLPSSVTTGGFGGLIPLKCSSKSPQTKVWNTKNLWNFCQIWMSSPPIDDFLATALVLSFLYKVNLNGLPTDRKGQTEKSCSASWYLFVTQIKVVRPIIQIWLVN